jgi:hypothetical protein
MSYKSEIWMTYLRQFKAKCQGIFHVKKQQKYAAVIIEPRKDEILDLVLNNFLYFLGNQWSLYIFHGTENEDYVKDITKNMGDIYFINLNKDNLSIKEYNELLTSKKFYDHFHCDQILIFQTDTLLRRPIDNKYLKYDYVGAPWRLDTPGIWKGMVGNGGLSLRNVYKMKNIIDIFKYDFSINEDGYFSYYSKFLNYNIPDFNTASEFSVETVFHPNPIGMHKPHIEIFPKKEYLELFSLNI